MIQREITDLSPSKSKQIIVARYKENISWLRWFKNIPFIVYEKRRKGLPNSLPNIPTFPVHQFEGVKHSKTPTGRESHTYLYHIIKNYDALADMNIFLQGCPIEIANDALNTLKILFERDFAGIDFLPLNFPVMVCDKRGATLHRGLPLERVFKRLFQGECPPQFAYTWGAMFCASKETIRRRPLAFYEEMMQIVYEEPLSGYVYERLWPTVLGCPTFLPHPAYPPKLRAAWQLPGWS